MRRKFEKFGEVMKEIRKNRGLTQAEVAEKIGVHSQFVSNAERSKCALPKVNMKRFVKALSLSQDERLEILDAIIKDHANTAREDWSPVMRIR